MLILADDMGYGDPVCYNPQSKMTTPHIDRLAADGIRLLDAHAPGSWCVPSRYGLLTGRYPARTTLNWQRRSLIEAGQTTLASLLKKHGYATACVGKWHLGFDSPSDRQTLETTQRLRGGPVDHGFDYFFGLPASLDIPPYGYIENDRSVASTTELTPEHQSPDATTPISGAFWREGRMSPGFQHEEVLPTLTQKALTWLETHHRRQPDVPFFLYAALTAPHTPWLPAPSVRGKSRAGSYGDFVIQVDQTVGEITAALNRLAVTDNTLFIFTSDNGPVWFAGDVAKYSHRAAGPWRGMKLDGWEGGHRIPFVARWPGHIRAGSVRSDLFCFTDLLATFSGIVGAPSTESMAPDSYNPLPVLLGQKLTQPVRRELLIESRIYRQDNWKYTRGSNAGPLNTRYGKAPLSSSATAGELYDLRNDPSESHNLYSVYPNRVKAIEQQLQRYSVQKPDVSAPSH